MYLKKIIANGFKSFADRVSITLERDHITGIVGPNGSGKSNVIDAVRWVMGEQNAKMLRGEKATDIIFAGSQKRKALAMAEVSLIFDNAEASRFCPPEYRHEPEIELTRRIYLDGEREYLINRKPCRLKDLIVFFAASGLGGRSYSIIQQGQVDRILQAKPEEIREMIEEAAGIEVFRRRKLETAKRLEATQLNMSRLADILSEVERQMQALAHQAEKAKKWQDLTADLRQRELSLYGHNFHFFNQNISDLSEKIRTSSDNELTLLAALTELERYYEVRRQHLEKADPRLQQIHEQIVSLREEIARGEVNLQNAIEAQKSSLSQLEMMESDSIEDEERYHELVKQVAEADELIGNADEFTEAMSGQIENLSDQLETLTEQMRVYDSKIQGWQQSTQEMERQLHMKLDRKDSLRKQLSGFAKEKLEIEKKLQEIEQDLSTTSIMAEAMAVRYAKQQRGLTQDYDEKNRLDLEVKNKDRKAKDLQKKIDTQKEDMMGWQVKMSTIEELEKSLDDLASFVHRFKASDASSDAIENVWLLTDSLIAKSSIKNLPETVLSVFGKWAERLIATDIFHFAAVKEIVIEQSWSYVPISVISQRDQRLIDKAKDLGLHSFSQYFEFSFEDRALSDLLDTIFYVPKDFDLSLVQTPQLENAVFFTEDGAVRESEYSFWVGKPGQAQSALARQQDKIEISAKLTQKKDALAHSEQQLNETEIELEVIKNRLRVLDNDLNQANKTSMTMMVESKGLEQKLALKKEHAIEIRRRYNELDEKNDELQDEITTLDDQCNTLEEEKARIDEDLSIARADSEDLRSEHREISMQLENKRRDLSNQTVKIQTLKEHYDHDKRDLKNLEEKLVRKRERQHELKASLAQNEEKQNLLQEQIATAIVGRDELEAELESKKAQNAELIGEIRLLEKKLKEQQDKITACKKTISDSQLELERATIAATSVKQQAIEKYQIDLNHYTFEIQRNFDMQKSQNEINKIREKIEGLGAINMVAIDEYRALATRQQFILDQKKEVDSSIDLLATAINEIMDKSRSQFMETYETLNVEFSGLFPILFPGGNAHLHLMDPTDPLESGVEIMVRLPGKNQQNMRLFSGGERALTAIALIFALLKSKPTPFCFLDEVDAPLDETNVGRYNKVLESLCDRFQFIVITHRRRTMEVLDTLYGVTMQEPGVSKVVGVDLAKAIPTHLQKAVKESSEQRHGASAG